MNQRYNENGPSKKGIIFPSISGAAERDIDKQSIEGLNNKTNGTTGNTASHLFFLMLPHFEASMIA